MPTISIPNDLVGLVVAYVWVFAVLGAGEGLRLIFKLPQDFTRKFVHIGVGLWAIGTVLTFQNWYLAVIPPLSFIVLNYIFHYPTPPAAGKRMKGEGLKRTGI